MSNNKTYRIRAKEGEEYVDVSLNLNQDIDMFEMLSLKITSKNFYKLHTSKYGCVAGRVLANNAIGVPNVKLSIFISADDSTKSDSVLNALYPYTSTFDKNDDGVVYNLLTEEQINECQKTAGTFPSKRLVLDDNNVFEIFDKYYKFTTTTNATGDYMIFGVPTGSQNIHMDVDLSNIGSLLSQTPRDFIYKGYDRNLFESPTQFKVGTDLATLPQILSQNENVYVYPFWGDPSEMKENNSTGVRISRKDINLSYKFEPTCIFFGSIISDEKSNGFSEKCVPTDRMGRMDKLTTGEGTIEMIRKKPDGDVESFNIGGTHLIDGDGTWCYQIPMNLDYIRMDEKGNIVPSDNPNKGLPTRTSVRFRFSLNDFASDYENNHLCKMLVPNNPHNIDGFTYNADGSIKDTLWYKFGTETRDEDFRDLLWNKVYSVKSYIPRIQKSDANKEKRFSGFKTVNVNGSNNPLPYNNIRVDITFMFILQCAIMHTLIWIVGVYNSFIGWLIYFLLNSISCASKDCERFTCLTVGDGACPDLEGWYFAPNCKEIVYKNPNSKKGAKIPLLEQTMKQVDKKVNGEIDVDGNEETFVDKTSIDVENNSYDEKVCVTAKIDYFIKCIELALAKEYEVIQFDFYNDWMNGVLYFPRWFAKVKKKRSYLFGLIKTRERVLGCMDTAFNIYRRYTQQCALNYSITADTSGDVNRIELTNNYGCRNNTNIQTCHRKKGRKFVKILKRKDWAPGGGVVHPELTTREQFAYYFRPRDFRKDSEKFVTFFASDIILLGSISNNDIDGIPYISELISSSYKMPTSLAATNMDIMGQMFGADGVGTNFDGIRCNSAAIPPIQPWQGTERTIIASSMTVNDTFENYAKFDQYEDRENPNDPDGIDTSNDTDVSNQPNEYPLTEASGLDWGYTGPEQSDIKETYDEGKDKRYRIYFKPGGHFLGLSCFNAETNVRSCVNLARICEIGVDMSRRKTVENIRQSERSLYVTPTGLISNYDIYDGDFRSIFATLNHNGLRTVFADNRRVYDIIPMYLTGFDGSIIRYTGWEGISKSYGNIEPREVFAKTPEVFDRSYYEFRLGLNNGRNLSLADVYALSNPYSLPMYNNSFYFYFGLHDGATALDKFHEKFYGDCNVIE